MAAKSESPTEIFKRALAHAARSLAEQPDLEVTFSSEGPHLSGKHAVLPYPPRDLNAPDTARIRGLADQMALRIAHHDDSAHARFRPAPPQSKAVFEAVEQARIEAIGANAMGGVRANLRAALESSLDKKGLNRLGDPAEAPIADIVGLLVRERLTGEPAPEAFRKLVDLHRGEIEAKAGGDLDKLVNRIDDQAAFARIARAIIKDLNLGEDLDDLENTSEDDDSEGTDQPEASDEDGQSQDQDDQSADADQAAAGDNDVGRRGPRPGGSSGGRRSR